MPSDLPKIVVRTDADTIIKIKEIAKANRRSVSKEVESLILKDIADFEKEHGEIKIGWKKPKEIKEDAIDRLLGKPPYGNN